MKKAFLIPVALAVAALGGEKTVDKVFMESKYKNDSSSQKELFMVPSNNGDNMKVATSHRSHGSHYSHRSHSSHYSGR